MEWMHQHDGANGGCPMDTLTAQLAELFQGHQYTPGFLLGNYCSR